MQRRQFMTVFAAGGATLALSACEDMPASAIAPWQGPDPSLTDPRLRALSWALLAPNPHNLQPWIADVREDGMIRLHVDPQRLLPVTDPYHRQILIGCGAFLELLCRALNHEGLHAHCTLFPQGVFSDKTVDARAFAEIAVTPSATTSADPLFAYVKARRTNRAPYSSATPTTQQLDRLAVAAKGPGISMDSATNPQAVQRLRELAIAGYQAEFAHPPAWQESAAVLRLGAAEVAREPSGFALLGPEIWWGQKLGIVSHAKLADPKGLGAKRAIDDSTAAATATPAWVWLVSQDSSRTTQIESGRSYMRLDLCATQLGLCLHPNSQVLQEFAEMAPLYREFHRTVAVLSPARVQMLARLGSAPAPRPAPRRPVSSLLKA